MPGMWKSWIIIGSEIDAARSPGRILKRELAARGLPINRPAPHVPSSRISKVLNGSG